MKEIASLKQRTRLLDFMNSRGTAVTGGVDLLKNGPAATRILSQFAVEEGRKTSIEKISPEILEVRSTLSEIVANPANRTAWATLNRLSERAQFSARLQPGKRSVLEPRSGNPIVASILKDVIEVMDRGEWERFKQCAREVCSSTYFDASRSRTQRWCPYSDCGNVMNVAAHRARTR